MTAMVAQRRELVVGHCRWLVRELGQSRSGSRPVVLIPGLGDGEYLMPHAKALATDRQVVVPDMPGFGRSRGTHRLRTVDDFGSALIDLIRAHERTPVDLVGNSFGTQIALAAAAIDPRAVRRLVLVGPTFDREARSYPKVLRRWVSIATKEPPALGPSLARSYWRSGVRTPLLAFRAGFRDRPEDRIACVDQPVLLVRGSKDAVAPPRWLKELKARAPDAQIVEIPDVAHTVDFSAPDRLAREVRRFLDAA
jgi:pimeloyl-ACP methyl ester carboxylesterase